jgi:hypothetical protein
LSRLGGQGLSRPQGVREFQDLAAADEKMTTGFFEPMQVKKNPMIAMGYKNQNS